MGKGKRRVKSGEGKWGKLNPGKVNQGATVSHLAPPLLVDTFEIDFVYSCSIPNTYFMLLRMFHHGFLTPSELSSLNVHV